MPGAERWAGYLDWVREELIAGVLALSSAERRTSRVPSGWSPIELLSHVLHMEQRWFVWGFLGEQVAEPWGDWSVDEPWAEGADGRWVVADDVTAEELAERLRAMGRRTTEVLASHPLDALASAGRAVRRRPTEPGVDLLPRPGRVRAGTPVTWTSRSSWPTADHGRFSIRNQVKVVLREGASVICEACSHQAKVGVPVEQYLRRRSRVGTVVVPRRGT